MTAGASITWQGEGNFSVLVAEGEVTGPSAAELTSTLRHLDPGQHPTVTLDLQNATILDPLVVNGLLAAWERRCERAGSVRVLVSPGPVRQFLAALGLTHAVHLVSAADLGTPTAGAPADRRLSTPPPGSSRVDDALERQDLTALRTACEQDWPVCDFCAAPPAGSGDRRRCPHHEQYGGCRAFFASVLGAAELGHWERARALARSLTRDLTPGRLPERSR
jgi:anti-anti-sigma regulatory factor